MATTSNILALPFRRGNHLSLSSAIKQYIDKKYDQHPDMFRQDLEVIDALRKDAINVREAHPSGIKKLQAYGAQLVWMVGKFPLDIGADFTWYPALGYNTERPMSRNNLKYELLNVLYNLAALYSQLAVSTQRGTTDGLKAAANFLCQAAGVLSHMQKEVVPELRMSSPPEDMDLNTLESLIQLCLAQSQECFWQKAVMDGYKDASIAKLAARVSDLYDLAGEAAVKSEAISSAWIHHMSAKHHHFAAAAQYRAACDCLDKRKYGEEIARLRDAVACVNEGLKETRGGYLHKTVVDDLNGIKRRVEEDLKRAEKDNDIIYLNVVPPKSELKKLERANMAVLRCPAQVSNPYEYLGDHAEFGTALFSKLVPFSVHVATSVYEERRDRLINNNIIQQLEQLTARLHEVLSSLGLPGSLQALEKPLGLPHTLVQHAEEVRQADAINRIQRGLSDLEKLRASDEEMFEEGKGILLAEEEEDNRLRLKFGTDRWTRPDSRNDMQGRKLWGHVTEIEGYFATSRSSDNLIREKFVSVKDLLTVLVGSDRGLLDFVPSSRRTDIPEALKPVIGRLRSAFNDVQRLESKRRKRVESLRQFGRSDDIKPDILKEAARLERTYPTTAIVPAHFEDFFEKRLDSLYDPELEAVEKDTLEQEKLLNEVTRINREFESQNRSAGDKCSRGREEALQKLDSAYFKYKDIVNNLDAGRKFYNDLSKIVGQMFRDQAKTWAAKRTLDGKSLEEELSLPPLSRLSMRSPVQSPPNMGYPHSRSNIPASAQTQPVHSGPDAALQNWNSAEAQIQSWADSTTSPQQPKPVPPGIQSTWRPDAGIRFGGPAGTSRAESGGENQTAGGIWNPNSGIKFG